MRERGAGGSGTLAAFAVRRFGSTPAGRRASSSAPSAATASEPPIERKNWIAAVATPRSATLTAFWVAITKTWNIVPMPTPITTSTALVTSFEESSSSVASRTQPTSTSVEPSSGKMR